MLNKFLELKVFALKAQQVSNATDILWFVAGLSCHAARIGYSHGKGYIDSFTFLLTHPLVVWQYPEKNVPDWYQACASHVRDRSFRLF